MKKISTLKFRNQKSVATAATTSKKPSFKQILALILVATIALFGVSGYYWYSQVFTNPDRILNGVLNKSMQTTSVYRTVSQQNSQNKVNQRVLVSFSPQLISKSVTDLQELSETAKTSVTTETLGTRDADYVRYTGIAIENQSGPQKKDFSKVLNVWSKRTGSTQTGDNTSFLNDALFVVVPFGNLSSDQRAQLQDKIQAVNLYDVKSHKASFQRGRPVMSYNVELDPQKLVQVLKKYVEITGVGSAAGLDPAQYEGAAKLQIQLDVDILSHHLRTVNFVGSGRVENYYGYNIAKTIDIPKQTIGTDELQTRLQALEQQR